MQEDHPTSTKDESTALYQNVSYIQHTLENKIFLFQDTQYSKQFISKFNGYFTRNVRLHQTQGETSKNSLTTMGLFHVASTETDDRPYAIGLAVK
jgi:hypothetical protein